MRYAVRTVAATVLLGLAGSGSAFAQATSFNAKSWTGPGPDGSAITISLTTPSTYGNCPSGETSDSVKTTGVPPQWVLQGWVRVYYLTNTGPQLVNEYTVNTYGDLTLQVAYTPSCLWPRLDTPYGPRYELHVDLAIVVLRPVTDASGAVQLLPVDWIGAAGWPGTMGPGQDWDVYCHNPPPCAGGCTPGFWKQSQHFSFWPSPYVPSSSFGTIFGVPTSMTMLQALQLGGGQLNALVRHGAAAFLNASSPLMTFGMSPAEVLAAFQAAVAPGGSISATAIMFDDMNNLGCPIK